MAVSSLIGTTNEATAWVGQGLRARVHKGDGERGEQNYNPLMLMRQ